MSSTNSSTTELPDQIHFVTGRLAEHSLRKILAQLAPQIGFHYTIDVLPITVAALMTTAWVRQHWSIPEGTTRIVLPGYCSGELDELRRTTPLPLDRGPNDLRRLDEFFGAANSGQAGAPEDYGAYDVEVLAEINHAPQLDLSTILQMADQLSQSGADIIDVGCDPDGTWNGVAQCVSALREAGHRVSIDSLNPREIELAVDAGAELVLSVNSKNRHLARQWNCEVVAIPDDPTTMSGLDETVDLLARQGVPLRIDPILEPIGFGFAASLGRYLEIRHRYPDAEIMMGIGNLTEMTDVDSAGINVLLLGFCQEIGVRSVLTTQVIQWARTSVRECDLARRLMHYAIRHRVPPKHLEPRLLTLRDPAPPEFDFDELAALADRIKDHNYRIFIGDDKLHLISAQLHLMHDDPFQLFEALLATNPRNVDPGHAFYLGFELAKALTALTLGKDYRQDESLDWGYLTVPENMHRLKRQSHQRSEEQRSRRAKAERKFPHPDEGD